MTLALNTRADITLDSIERVAWRGEDVRFDGESLTRMADTRAAFLRLIEDPDIVVYGVTSRHFSTWFATPFLRCPVLVLLAAMLRRCSDVSPNEYSLAT